MATRASSYGDLTRWNLRAESLLVNARLSDIGAAIRCVQCGRIFDKIVWNKTFCSPLCRKIFGEKKAVWQQREETRQRILEQDRLKQLLGTEPEDDDGETAITPEIRDRYKRGQKVRAEALKPYAEKEKSMNVVYRIVWTESEAGMGCRPDGVSYAFDKFLLEEKSKQMNQTGSAECYTRGGDIGMCIVDDELRQKIHDHKGVFTTWRLDDPGMKGEFIPRETS